MPNCFDVLLFFQAQMPGSDLAFFEPPCVVDSCIEMKVQTRTQWTKARLFQSGRVWYVEYPLDDSCMVTRAIEQEHYAFIENAQIGLSKALS